MLVVLAASSSIKVGIAGEDVYNLYDSLSI
jgi:hypothetical protein